MLGTSKQINGRQQNTMGHIYVIAEIGINHNGDMGIAKQLIDVAKFAGCDAVKFQKRTIERVYTKEFLDSPRESPWGATQRAQKEGLEFDRAQYEEIDRYCKDKRIDWFASAWDTDAQEFLRSFDLPRNKVASAMLGNTEFLGMVAEERKPTIISTGMCTVDEIDSVVDLFKSKQCPFELMHCVSTYPMENGDANLLVIRALAERFGCPVGYSGHERGLQISIAAAALGASSIERHITLDRTMYGSDQAASVEPSGLLKLVRDIRVIQKALGTGEKTIIPGEQKIREKLRG